MLDLTDKVKYFELKWFDGELLHILPVSVKTQRKFMTLQNVDEESVEALDTLVDIVLTIVNNNKENRKFDREDIENRPFEAIQRIILDYLGAINSELGE